jgi:hypothetical protein
MRIETKQLRLHRPVELGQRIGRWRMTSLGVIALRNRCSAVSDTVFGRNFIEPAACSIAHEAGRQRYILSGGLRSGW